MQYHTGVGSILRAFPYVDGVLRMPYRIPLLPPVAYALSNSVNNLVESCSDDRLLKGLHKDRGKTKALEPIERRREGGGLTC